MRTFKVLYPDRAAQQAPTCSCGLACCGIVHVERGTSGTITAIDKRDAWDKCRRLFPFEKIIIEQ